MDSFSTVITIEFAEYLAQAAAAYMTEQRKIPIEKLNFISRISNKKAGAGPPFWLTNDLREVQSKITTAINAAHHRWGTT